MVFMYKLSVRKIITYAIIYNTHNKYHHDYFNDKRDRGVSQHLVSSPNEFSCGV